ncbi:TniQ family protein [Streptomyces pinistramenti]|uniref:TniQ family protein n=1 Tax=Streptomyces pinistramenti TaxID=2884812 RepID=UPI001D08B654|nr:TniQ family protein [Streptomyces pinistramenti]MCB5906036.1 TniQ family protein [Streptomyces pinistramenti]
MPRSLIPLPGESVAGFILRLSHRLRVAPSNVTWRTGLTPHRFGSGFSPIRHLLMMEPTEASAFAHAARMSAADAERLTLLPYLRRCPPVSGALRRQPDGPPRARSVFPSWLLIGSTRYCPACLRGDGSVIQARHGGAWQLLWHLPVVFACLEHQVLLQDSCPACRHPASRHPEGRLKLVPSPTAAELHPVQCRNSGLSANIGRTFCGHRLDDSSSLTETRLSSELAVLQQKILDWLSPDTPAQTAFHNFADLLVMASIVNATWPHGAAATDLPHALSAAFDEHLAVQQRAAESVGGKPPHRSSRHPSLWSTEPRSSAATAALLAIAHAHLQHPVHRMRKTLITLLEHAPETADRRWGSTWGTLQLDASPLIRHEIDNAFRRRFPAQHPPGTSDQPDRTACVIPVRTRGYRAESIPQHIPDEWFTLVSNASRPKPLPRSPQATGLRRALAVQLVQAVTGMRMDEAARFLGVPAHWIGHFPAPLHPLRLIFQKDPYDLPGALEYLGEHIASLPEPIDHRQRRETFRSWNLTTTAWKRIRRSHPAPQWSSRPGAEGRENRLRECSSAVIWTYLTGSEWKLAPCFRPAQASAARTFTIPEKALVNELSDPPDGVIRTELAVLLRRTAEEILKSKLGHRQQLSVTT